MRMYHFACNTVLYVLRGPLHRVVLRPLRRIVSGSVDKYL